MSIDMGALKAAARAYRRAKKNADERYSTLVELIVSAADSERQVDIVNATGYSRERIRQIVEADRKKRGAPHDDSSDTSRDGHHGSGPGSPR